MPSRHRCRRFLATVATLAALAAQRRVRHQSTEFQLIPSGTYPLRELMQLLTYQAIID